MPFPLLPPAFSLVVLDGARDAFARACAAASADAADGTFVWADVAGRLNVAVVLEPEAGTDETLQAYWVWAAAAIDALDALLPPMIPVRLAWPDRLMLAGATAGQLRCAIGRLEPPRPIPPWLVLGLTLEIAETRAEPGLEPDRTTLEGEGAGDLTSAEIAEALARHFLLRMDRWQEEGFAPIGAHLSTRLDRAACAAHPRLAGRMSADDIEGLDRHGRLVAGSEAIPLAITLDELGRNG